MWYVYGNFNRTTAANDSLSLPGSACDTSTPTSMQCLSKSHDKELGGSWKTPAVPARAGALGTRVWLVPPSLVLIFINRLS